VTEAELWENLEYFLDEVVPVAEEAGVDLALHPDDPPVDSVRGVPRLVNSVENVQRILDLHDSPNHGLTFCQGNNYAAMGADSRDDPAVRRSDPLRTSGMSTEHPSRSSRRGRTTGPQTCSPR